MEASGAIKKKKMYKKGKEKFQQPRVDPLFIQFKTMKTFSSCLFISI